MAAQAVPSGNILNESVLQITAMHSVFYHALSPGPYEVIGSSDIVMGPKIRVTTQPWLEDNPEVLAYLYEGQCVLLLPWHCAPTVLSTGEARICVCFGLTSVPQHWGWVTYDPFYVDPEKSIPWLHRYNYINPSQTQLERPPTPPPPPALPDGADKGGEEHEPEWQ
jgi:hypothetical protein